MSKKKCLSEVFWTLLVQEQKNELWEVEGQVWRVTWLSKWTWVPRSTPAECLTEERNLELLSKKLPFVQKLKWLLPAIIFIYSSIMFLSKDEDREMKCRHLMCEDFVNILYCMAVLFFFLYNVEFQTVFWVTVTFCSGCLLIGDLIKTILLLNLQCIALVFGSSTNRLVILHVPFKHMRIAKEDQTRGLECCLSVWPSPDA